jgi:dCMP deaminase
MDRLSWDEYFLSFLPIIGSRSTCDRGKPACIITKDRRIISTGYAGSVSGTKHCSEVGHLIQRQLNDDESISESCVRTVHAEQNAISQAVKNGVSTENATIYITMEPCFSCCKLLIQSGITRIVCLKRYVNGKLSRQLCEDTNTELVIMNDELEKY